MALYNGRIYLPTIVFLAKKLIRLKPKIKQPIIDFWGENMWTAFEVLIAACEALVLLYEANLDPNGNYDPA